MAMPLEGVRVIDCSTWHMGPEATRMLSDLGADVIKVEQLHTSDPCRGIKPNWGVPTALPGGRNWYVEATNRNKRAISLDQGKEILYRLVEKSDVFVNNFRDKAVAKLGLDYETLSRHNSRLIYATASGLGRKGPDRNAWILDMVAQARSGIMSTVTDNGVPLPLRVVQRARIIRMAADGMQSQDIARSLGISRPSVQLWRQRFLAFRLVGLQKRSL